MVERTLLIPEHHIEVPDELGELFDVLDQVFAPDTPIWKTTECETDETYPTMHGPVLDTDFILEVDVPVTRSRRFSFSPSLRIGRLMSLSGQPSEGARAKVSFAEQHVVEPDRSRLDTESRDVWQLYIEALTTQKEHIHTLTRFAGNSLGEFASVEQKWSRRNRSNDSKDFDINSEKILQTARLAGRLLTPLFAED